MVFEFAGEKRHLNLRPRWPGTSVKTAKCPETKDQPKGEVFGRTSMRTSGQKRLSGPPKPGKKNKHFGMDMPRGRPRKNFGLKNFGLIFRSLIMPKSA